MKPQFDVTLYLVTDRELAGERPLEDVVATAVSGGVTMVQLREKNCTTREYVEIARKMLALLKPLKIPLIINDRVDVALAVKADGVHLGQEDMPYQIARQLMGPDAIIGLSVETPEQARQAEELDADYLGVSAIFSTPTKTDTKTEWGIEGLRKLRGKSQHNLVGIGGLNASNARAVIRAGADGIAVVSAICAAPNPEKAARELRKIIENARRI